MPSLFASNGDFFVTMGSMIGIDEVGRGAWAGPLLVVAARQVSEFPIGLNDSKVLSKKKRESLYYEIKLSCDIGEGWVSPQEIDENGLTVAMEIAVERALESLKAGVYEEIVIDGHINYCDEKYLRAVAVIDADATHSIVSAASIYAKVTRDNLMSKIAANYPEYGFDGHVGYGTKQHIAMLKTHGVTDLHRKSYAPIKRLIYGY